LVKDNSTDKLAFISAGFAFLLLAFTCLNFSTFFVIGLLAFFAIHLAVHTDLLRALSTGKRTIDAIRLSALNT
jgi:hypothetical protein